VQENHDEAVADIRRIETGHAVFHAVVVDGDYACGIMRGHRVIYFRRGWEPVPVGYWMDWAESGWGISEAAYKKLLVEARAALECREQLDRWIALEYDLQWLEYYEPEVYDARWWGRSLGDNGIFELKFQRWAKRTAAKLHAEKVA